MKKIGFALIAAFALSSAQALAVPVYIENPDADVFGGSPQYAGTDITSITGTIGGGDVEDLFSFSWSGGLFDATSLSALNTTLFLFDEFGALIDSNGSNASAPLTNGDYLLGISINANDTRPESDYTINISSVPEPAPLALLVLGLTAIGLAKRKHS